MTFVPCTSISWLMEDTYICDISHSEDTTLASKAIIAKTEDIFPIDIYELAQNIIKSQGWADREWSHGGKLEVTSLKNKVVENWYIYKGGLFTNLIHMGGGYFAQFIISKDILSKSGIVMVNDPVIPTGRIIIEERDKPRNQGQKFTLGRQHKLVLDCIERDGPATTFTIAEKLDLPISSIAGRISELSRQGMVKCVSYDYSTGIKRKIWGDENHKSWI